MVYDYIPKGKKRTGKKLEPTTLTIHSNANLKSTARNERDWLTNSFNTTATGWHVVVDASQAICAIPFDEVAYHTGTDAGNYSSIGLEICESGNRAKTVRHAIEVTAEILNSKGWGVDRLRQHHDWNGGECPRILRTADLWDWFKNEVDKLLEITIEQAKHIIKEKAMLADETIQFLYNYRYGDELLIKLAKAIK